MLALVPRSLQAILISVSAVTRQVVYLWILLGVNVLFFGQAPS